MAKAFLFDADLNAILSSIPDGVRIMRHSAGFARQDDSPFIRKVNGEFVKPNGSIYSKSSILADISNKRISIGELIVAAEKAGGLSMEFDKEHGKISIYNTTLEEIRDKGNEHLKSDALILFTERFDAAEVKKLGILVEGPVKLSQFVFDKICARSANARRNGHGYTVEELAEVKEQLQHPLAVIRTQSKDGSAAVAILTKAKDYKGNLSLVVVAPDKERGDNYISSIYGKENVIHYLMTQQQKGNVSYINPEIITELDEKLSEKERQDIKEILKLEKEIGLKKKTTLGNIKRVIEKRRSSL